MSFFELVLRLVIIGCAAGVLKSFIEYRRKVAEMRLAAGDKGNETLVTELQEVKKQLAALRDTTTQYDVSFDAALQRLESRTSSVEQRMSQMERAAQRTHSN